MQPQSGGICVIAAVLALYTGTASIAQGDTPREHAKGKDGPPKRLHAPVTWRGKPPFACDPARFEGKPHYAMVRMKGGMIASIHLLRTEDGEEVVTSHPYGTARAIVTEDTRALCMRPEHLERFVDRLERRQRLAQALEPGPDASARAGAPTATAYNTGLPIGWNPSTGQAPASATTSPPPSRPTMSAA
jgi:hypothetical protein